MSNPRTARASLKFNGKTVDTSLKDYLQSVEYTDIADGSSDEISIEVQDMDLRWMKGWAPKKGDRITGEFTYENWNKDGDKFSLKCGDFTLDEIKFSGGPRMLKMSAVAVPASESFKTRDRTKTWKAITVRNILKQIATRYKLKYRYDAGVIKVSKLEQSDKTDCAFLAELCKRYGLGLKIFRNRLIVYDKGKYEKRKSVATLGPKDFVDDDWEYDSDIHGTYTGCKISYKTPKKKKKGEKKPKPLTAYVGTKGENAKGARTKKLNQQCNSAKEAKQVAAAEVNRSNEKADVISGQIMANSKICAACCITLKGFGKFDGKYFVDKSTTSIDNGGAKQEIEMHKVQRRVTANKKKAAKKKKTTTKKK